jgi:predicted AlkP superfamily phosphohydrolase/phosphomutase
VAQGVMPHLGKLLNEGHLAPLESVHPPLSSVAWTTFATGVNPGKHRIFGFFESQIDEYGLWFQNLNDVKAPALWEVLQQHGMRTVSINLPGTFPAPPLNGIMISGFIAEDIDRSVYPKMLRPALDRLGYMLDVPCKDAPRQPQAFFETVHQSLEARAKMISVMLEHEPFDLFVGVLTETDRVQHFFWDATEEPRHPLRESVLRFYQAVDRAVGHWVARCRPDDELIILADHGFCRIEQDLYINRWLQDHGWLQMKTSDPGAMLKDIDPARSCAYSLDPGRIYLNVRGRQPDGCVAPADVPRLLDELSAGLRELTIKVPWSPAPIHPIANIFRPAEIYKGPWAAQAPDLVLHSVNGFEMRGRFNAPSLASLGELTGMHTFEDAMLFIRNRRWNSESPRMIDLAPTILSLLDIELPAHLDGRPLI